VSGCFVSVVSEDEERIFHGVLSVWYICLFFSGHVVLLPVVVPKAQFQDARPQRAPHISEVGPDRS